MIQEILTLIILFFPAFLGIFIFRQRPVQLKHKESSVRKTARLGWSWTYFYFGFLVPVVRGEVAIGLLHMIITFFTLGLFQFVWSFLYNKQQLVRLLTNGWVLDDAPKMENLVRKKLRMD